MIRGGEQNTLWDLLCSPHYLRPFSEGHNFVCYNSYLLNFVPSLPLCFAPAIDSGFPTNALSSAQAGAIGLQRQDILVSFVLVSEL